ncbi:MAG: peptidoglycan DD-metalloendopeptidase family protein [Natronohydrobacter sp.]|nr:peptidoglycan DD-metalloendopeptidase family protein [Natronohydrobacter sp.]
MSRTPKTVLLCSAAMLALSACSDFDMDMRRSENGFSTTEAARQATAARPRPDARGIITYPDYQVVVARPGDTVAAVAQRIGMSEGELARFNALDATTALRGGEVLALPRVVDAPSAATGGAQSGGAIEISTLADAAISRAEGNAPAPAPVPEAPRPVVQPAAEQPRQHRVQRGETAFQIARLYNVAPRALADWNGLDPEMRVREGQVLMIPVPDQPAPVRAAPAPAPAPEPVVAPPGAGSSTPLPPSASQPLPPPEPPAREQAAAAQEARPPSPALSESRTEATRPRFVMPVDGRIIRAYAPGRNEGIGIAASAGTPVKATAAGRVAAITEDTNKVPVVVIQHDNGLLSVYAQLDGLTVARGATVTQGQTIGRVRAGDPSFLHFEVRQGMNSVDPMRYLQ